jgi:5-bromo-4-chloroindolyl phosphate hydrolysis protein
MRYLKANWEELKNKINDMEKDFIKAQLIYAFYENCFKRMINRQSQRVIE